MLLPIRNKRYAHTRKVPFIWGGRAQLDPIYTETLSLVSVTFWLRLHLPFTRKRRKLFGKRMLSKTASKVDPYRSHVNEQKRIDLFLDKKIVVPGSKERSLTRSLEFR